MRPLVLRSAFHPLRRARSVIAGDAGMATAEYAIGTCAAAGLGGILYKLLTGDAVMKLLEGLVGKALSFVF